MATSKIAATEGSGVNIATTSITEDAVTKQLQRNILNKSDGTEIGTVSAPVYIVGSVQGTFTSGTSSVSGTVGASVIGTVPVTQSGSWVSSVSGTVGASIIGAININPSSVSGTVGASVIGVVPITQTGIVISSIAGTVIVGSIVGTYTEDAASADGDKGLMVLGIRNDTIASVVGADKDYTTFAMDSAGRLLVKPFAPEESRLSAVSSVVSSSITSLFPAAGAGLRNYLTDLMVTNSGATTALITFTDGDASVIGRTIAPSTGGSNAVGMATPMRTGGFNQAISYQPSASSSIIGVTAYGYKAP